MKTALLIVLQLAASGSDAYFTNRGAQSGGIFREHNPFARPFVHSTKGCVVFFSSEALAGILVPHELRKHHHAKLAMAYSLGSIASNVEGAAFTGTHQ
jgi:hypothetical protein